MSAIVAKIKPKNDSTFMSKRKLTQNQTRRIRANNNKAVAHHRAQKAAKYDEQWTDEMLGPTQEGLVVSRYAMHADIENAQGAVFRCNLRRTLYQLVVGDQVVWREGNAQLQGVSGVVEAIMPRRNVIMRPDYYDGLKPIAANLDRIIIVSAIVPELSFNMIDRYLVVCEDAGIEPLIVINKGDLLSAQEEAELEEKLQIYRDIGYETLIISAATGKNMPQLMAYLKQGTSIFVGQSGVGKSSLINHLLPHEDAATGAVSDISGLGQHTTTASKLYHLPEGGNLIDSPGIREFGLWHLTVEQINKGYREFQYVLGSCKFRDCKHLEDPGCALKEAVAEGKISALRFANYHRLIEALTETRAQRHFSTN